MGLKLSREKPRSLLLSVIYRLSKLLPLKKESKLRLSLNLEWIFERLAHEQSYQWYGTKNHPTRKLGREFILSEINGSDTVLDVGCKSGDIAYSIAEKAREVIAIDYDPVAINKAKSEFKKDNLFFYNKEAFQFLKENNRSYDVLILSHILEHLDNPKQFLTDISKYVNKIYVEVPDFDRTFQNTYRLDLGLKLVYSDDDHVSEFDRNELITLLNECGISVYKSEYRFGVQKHWCTVN